MKIITTTKFTIHLIKKIGPLNEVVNIYITILENILKPRIDKSLAVTRKLYSLS